MSAFIILIGVSLVVAIGFLFAFFWAVGNRQYEDEYTPSVRMLFEEDAPEKAEQRSEEAPAKTP
jgi:cbb3-type cytochrome oxidase maturation protein